MKLHRTLATAVGAAVIGPVALLGAPAAWAAGEAPTAGGTPAASAAATPGGRPAGPSAPEAEAPAASASATPAGNESATPSATPSPVWTRPTFCSPVFDVDRGKTGLRGLPSKIVAGSGWHEFAYRVTNVSKITVMETDTSLALGTGDPKIKDVAELAVTVQWFNPATGKWKPIEGEGAKFQDNDDFTTIKRLAPGQHADARMRIKIGKKAKTGAGYFFTMGYSYAEDGTCGFDKISRFDFKVLSAGSKPGKVADAKGKPGKPGKPGEQGMPNRPGIQGGTGAAGNKPAAQGTHAAVPATGKLATTGSSSALPTVAALGGAAVVAGAGAVFVVRRRKAGSGA
ncbi:LPXTG cell wall anchor domain-containing protein [Streptomyces chattanoogensis]